MAQIELTCGDILALRADALVCPAHKHLIRGRGLSAQVYDRGGAALAAACEQQPECAVGEARLTRAYSLPVKYLLHTVTPQWSSGDQWGAQALVELRRCYESVLSLALQNRLKTLLFPALGAGTNRFPHEIAAHQALEVLLEHVGEFDKLTVCLHTPTALAEWRRVGKRFFGG
ncbi:O-acetyl-ADP-ribose deacetylase (regulator of RNase III), contains Macro domain [Microbulbifer donghaiensis]|uniref:O-acetyl-ADP-ribose deacetylase (Regulator of RNase III), contains Macro domain n=1 Tax=Microbulbifer donghaiensis TaxID=494016 RepID=A0A1M5A609_9GAMM|nr:macro domain-containing protein [Microbulbifer donghaiensis]SHF25584.1 O-acetyl-ADP-ribose deacetylase (regulator of RNase III), contains Macro domain [Microbulbifer donghaiensis]